MSFSWLPSCCQAAAVRHGEMFAGRGTYVPLGLSLRNAFSINRFEYLHDPEALLANELAKASAQAAIGSDIVPCLVVRHDPVVLPLLFGGEVANVGGRPMFEPFLPDLESLPLAVPSLDAGIASQVYRTLEFFRSRAPAGMFVCKPPQLDPFDAALLMRGSDLLLEMVEQPAAVERLLRVVTEAFVALETRFKSIVGEPRHQSVTYLGTVIPGVRVAADSLVNLSPEMIRRFCFPIFERLAREFGGVLVHYCPSPVLKYYHVLATLCECPSVIGIDTSGGIDYFDHPDNPARLDPRLTQVADCALRRTETPSNVPDRHPNINRFTVRPWAGVPAWLGGDYMTRHRTQGRGVVLRATVDSIEEGRELLELWRGLTVWSPRETNTTGSIETGEDRHGRACLQTR